jgi:photosystem II stability/assembly factor-like uncharacterized protein
LRVTIKPPNFATAFTVLVFSLFSNIFASWHLEVIDIDAGEQLRNMIRHTSGNLVIVGDDNTILVSQNNGKDWKEADIPDVSGFGESDDISIRNIIELPKTHELLTLGVIDQKHQSGPVGMSGGPSWSTTRIEKWTAILVSSDGGSTWQLMEKIDNAALYWPLIFSDGQCILFGYSDIIYQYYNGKAYEFARNALSSENSVQRLSIPFAGDIILNEKRQITRYRDYLFTVEERKSIGVSLNRGCTWSILQTRGGLDAINGIAVLDEQSMVAACDNGLVAVSGDAGINWSTKKIAENNLNAVFASSRCDWWVVGDEGYIAYSQNSGSTWTRVESECDEDLTNILFNRNCNEGWILGREGALIHISDQRIDPFDETEASPEQKISWSSRAANDASEWYKNLDTLDDLSQGLKLTIEPDGAQIQVDNHSYIGKNVKIALPPGKHSLLVSKDGYFSEEDSIEISIGATEEKDIVLRPVKITFSASGGLVTDGSLGVLFSLATGVLGNKKNSAGLLLDVGLMIQKRTTFIDICPYYSHRFDVNNKVFVAPFVAAGGTYIKETADSMYLDTSTTRDHLDTIDNGHTAIFYDMALQAGIDANFRKNQNWGFSLKPSLLWTRKLGFQVMFRFGAIFWIL